MPTLSPVLRPLCFESLLTSFGITLNRLAEVAELPRSQPARFHCPDENKEGRRGLDDSSKFTQPMGGNAGSPD